MLKAVREEKKIKCGLRTDPDQAATTLSNK